MALPEEELSSRETVFCKDHLQSSLSPGAIIFLVVLALLLSALFIIREFVIPLGTIILIGLAANKKRLDRKLWGKRLGQQSKTYGLYPRYRFNVFEKWELNVNLGLAPSKYFDYQKSQGNFTLLLKLDDHENQRFIKSSEAVEYERIHAGFLRLFNTESVSIVKDPETAFALSGPIPENFESTIRNRKSFGIQFEYEGKLKKEIPSKSGTPFLPFWIFPGKTASEMNSRSWGLEFRVTNPQMRKLYVKALTVHIPPELEGVEVTDGLYESEKRQIFWENIKATPENPCTVFVEFLRPLHNTQQINAHYHIEIEGRCISGFDIQPKYIWDPMGYPADETKITINKSTIIEGDINVATRLQPKRQEVISQRKRIIPGIPLTSRLAHSIIDTLSNRDVYAKYIFEAPAIIAMHEEGSILSRYWEIIGRHYSRYHPYDVHVILTGEEPQISDKLSYEPALNFEIIIRGFTDMQFQAEKQDVEALAKDLEVAISDLTKNEKNHARIQYS
jgi:hypothetical protein